MKKMKFLFIVGLLVMVSAFVQAQDEDISDENLRRYALLTETVDAMKSEISSTVKQMISDQDGMKGKRFNELNKVEGEPATEFEQKFMDLVEEMKNERIADIKKVNQILATKMLPNGGKTYKAIKAALSSDEAVKARYEAILAKVMEPVVGA